MQFTTSKENLNLAANAAQKAINPRSIIPVYSCIKVEVADNQATFSGAGLDYYISCTIPVQMQSGGTALVPAKHFTDILRRLPDVPITMEHADTMDLSIRYEKSIFSLKTISSTDFPSPAVFREGMDFTIASEVFKKMIRQSAFASSADELKGVFAGLLWEIDGDTLSLIGTDTHRLALVKGEINNTDKEAKGSFIIPAKIAAEVSRLVTEEPCRVQVEKNAVFFSFDNIHMHCQMLKGSFPDYQSVMPKDFISTIKLNNQVIREITERISLFASANETSVVIYLDLSEGLLSVHSRSDIGYGREEIVIQHEGEDLSIAFSSRYLTDVFKVMDGEQIDMMFSGRLSSSIILDQEDKDFTYLVLPVRT